MESFTSASDILSSDSNAAFLINSSLKEYTMDLSENLPVSQVATVDLLTFNFLAVPRNFKDVYLSVVDHGCTRGFGAGVLMAALTYGLWKAIVACSLSPGCSKPGPRHRPDVSPAKRTRQGSLRKPPCTTTSRHGVNTTQNKSSPQTERPKCPFVSPAHKSTQTDGNWDRLEADQRQLTEVLSELSQLKFRMKELDKDKELLVAEVQVRKDMVSQLQGENSSERDKRQQAELKMEMMSAENSQIRHLKKEVIIKSGQIQKLERLMKEKDDLYMTIFKDNVILPRTLVETRAQEFSELQNRVFLLQAELESSRRFQNCQIDCRQTRILHSNWLEGGVSLSLPAPRLSDESVSSKNQSSQVSYPAPVSYPAQGKTHPGLPPTKLRLTDRSPSVARPDILSPKKSSYVINKARTSPSLNSISKLSSLGKYANTAKDSRSTGNICSSNVSRQPKDCANPDRADHHKQAGLLGHVRALVGGFRDNAECSSTKTALLKELKALLNDKSQKKSGPRRDKPTARRPGDVPAAAGRYSECSDSDCSGRRRVRKCHGSNPALVKRINKSRRLREASLTNKRRLAVQYCEGQARLLGLAHRSPQTSQPPTDHKPVVQCPSSPGQQTDYTSSSDERDEF